MTEPTLQCRAVARQFPISVIAVAPPRWRLRAVVAVGGVAWLLSGCAASAGMPVDSASGAREAASRSIATVESSPLVLVPRPAGEPLPPPNRAVAGNWPADVRGLIVAMVSLFPHFPQRKLDLDEIAGTLHIRLEPQPVYPRLEGVEREYAIWGWALARLNADDRFRLLFDQSSLIFMKPKLGERLVIATFLIDTSRYCVNPYEFAVYTGGRYSPLAPPGGFTPPYSSSEPQYQWGMFDNHTPTRTYRGSEGAAITTDGKCISSFSLESHEPEVEQ